MAETAIEWTDKVWNPTVGCTRVSDGCRHCYAFELHDRRHAAYRAGAKLPAQYAKPFKDVQLMPDRLDQPLHWRQPCRVFVNSMSDLFHEDVPDEFIDRVFAVMALAGEHTFQVLTKRPQRLRHYLDGWVHGQCPRCSDYGMRCTHQKAYGADRVARACGAMGFSLGMAAEVNAAMLQLPLPHCWLGVSVEDQQRADERIPLLLQVPATVRFLSCEPLLGPIDTCLSNDLISCPHCHGFGGPLHDGSSPEERLFNTCTKQCVACGGTGNALHWVIIGGESGPNARPCNLEWIRSLVQQCRKAGLACFVKQLGSRPVPQTMQDIELIAASHCGRRFIGFDPKGGNPDQWPEDLRIREFPR